MRMWSVCERGFSRMTPELVTMTVSAAMMREGSGMLAREL